MLGLVDVPGRPTLSPGGRGRNTGGREGNGLDAIYERLWGKEKNIKIVASTNIYKRKKVSSCVLDLVF